MVSGPSRPMSISASGSALDTSIAAVGDSAACGPSAAFPFPLLCAPIATADGGSGIAALPPPTSIPLATSPLEVCFNDFAACCGGPSPSSRALFFAPPPSHPTQPLLAPCPSVPVVAVAAAAAAAVAT
ncbi:unnamed protein product, partial [Ectocarpus sp. 8 AP-2014]